MEPHALVYDYGQYETKFGHAGVDLPSYVQHTPLFHNDALHNTLVIPKKDMVLKEDCFLDHLQLGAKYLHLDLKDHALMIPDASEERGKRMEALFDIVPAVYFGVRPVLSAFQAGKTTALIIDIGHTKTTVCAVHDGYHLKKSLQTNNTAGLALNEAILKSLEENFNYTPKVVVGKPLDDSINEQILKVLQMHTIHQFKEHCLTASSFVPGQSTGKPFEFPDGFSQVFQKEPYLVDTLFQPANDTPLMKMIQSCVEACDVECRNLLAQNVVVTGGSSSILGLPERIEAEITRHGILKGKVKVHASPQSSDRRFGSWIGGSILASCDSFQSMWITKDEYEEHGKAILERKCLA